MENAGSVNSSRNATPKDAMSLKSGLNQGGLRIVNSDGALLQNGVDRQEERKERFTGRSTLPNAFG